MAVECKIYKLYFFLISGCLVTSVNASQTKEYQSYSSPYVANIDHLLGYVTNLTTGLIPCSIRYKSVAIPITTVQYEWTERTAGLLARVFLDYSRETNPEKGLLPFLTNIQAHIERKVVDVQESLQDSHHKNMIRSAIKNLVLTDKNIFRANVVLLPQPSETNNKSLHLLAYRPNQISKKVIVPSQDEIYLQDTPWYNLSKEKFEKHAHTSNWYNSLNNSLLWINNFANWTFPYFDCEKNQWIISYTIPLITFPDNQYSLKVNGNNESNVNNNLKETKPRFIGVFSVEIDLTHLDINQCGDIFDDTGSNDLGKNILQMFRGTHKCDNSSTRCVFLSGHGWKRGSYKCVCRQNFYRRDFDASNLTNAEMMWLNPNDPSSLYQQLSLSCQACSPGCDTCVDETPCWSKYRKELRIPLLAISVACILFTMCLVGFVYKFRKIKVIKVASPIFLCLTILGAIIMYSEMAAIFPMPNIYSCIAIKWTRHLGFGVTYSALLLKTWRVSLTHRVKSAHKIKLTDKQLLQWLFPILLVMIIYLSTWTVSIPPDTDILIDSDDLKFHQCSYTWWDHSLVIGEALFLLWGIRICYIVRHAESYFNEAKYITWAIYNIGLTNFFMLLIHLFLFPHASPDIKYVFAFIRTQMSTTVTLILVFGPKIYRIFKGQGDVYDNTTITQGITTSFSLNGIGLMQEDSSMDLYQENEELKEEIQKLAAQIEMMRIMHMEIGNRHLKQKHGGGLHSTALGNAGPLVRSMRGKFTESPETPVARLSPAAELASERV